MAACLPASATAGAGNDDALEAAGGWERIYVDLPGFGGTPALEGKGGLPEFADWLDDVVADLSDTASGWGLPDDAAGPGFDLVAASFLLAPGGRLVLVSHAVRPPWAPAEFGTRGHFPSPADELAALGVPASGDARWDVEVAEVHTREVTAPDGQPGVLEDAVVVVRRR